MIPHLLPSSHRIQINDIYVRVSTAHPHPHKYEHTHAYPCHHRILNLIGYFTTRNTSIPNFYYQFLVSNGRKMYQFCGAPI